MANQEVTIGGKAISLLTPKRDLTPASRQAGGKYHKKLRRGPGNSILLKGTEQHGWYGEVPSGEFITGEALSSALGGNLRSANK